MQKACPVVLRLVNNNLELLAFKHPDGSFQLAKGGVKKGEKLEDACVRELVEESGVKAEVVRCLGSWQPASKKSVWGFCLMHYEGVLPGRWSHATHDDGGHIFDFFWQPLDQPLQGHWKPNSRGAIKFIQQQLA